MFGRIGIGEFALIFLAVLILFGPAKLPELARSIGTAIKEFKKSLKDTTEESKDIK